VRIDLLVCDVVAIRRIAGI